MHFPRPESEIGRCMYRAGETTSSARIMKIHVYEAFTLWETSEYGSDPVDSPEVVCTSDAILIEE